MKICSKNLLSVFIAFSFLLNSQATTAGFLWFGKDREKDKDEKGKEKKSETKKTKTVSCQYV